ncbi:YkvA family protein [Thermoactinomyces mirandus]|uniref:DUF1232 domain-containing protein n=1 Tax=Thermoactinomyces mirandus TaxID=2756294 RepID=A0A7W1XQI0_9BACL|nr:YkvA family protein [Thermoactinomyces mirandus]MBA4601413.1 DUF1232 domain-containing protein [Thermoactinomyces mirandus]
MKQSDHRKMVAMLSDLKERALTREGEKTIIDQFNDKIARVGGIQAVIHKLKVMYNYFRDPRVSKMKKGLAGAALLYFILPTDIIFDWVPLMGYVDDMTAVLFVWRLLSKELDQFERDCEQTR